MPTLPEIQTCVNSLTCSSADIDFALLAKQGDVATTNKHNVVATLNDLPCLGCAENANISNGQIISVSSIAEPVIAYNCCWIGLDRRILRKDKSTCFILTWGLNQCGTSGQGVTAGCSSAPGLLCRGSIIDWCGLSMGWRHGVAIRSNGQIWTWGYSNRGALGSLGVLGRSSPGTVAGGGTTWSQITAGTMVTGGIKTDGTLWTWGYGISVGSNLNFGGISSPGTVAGGGTNWCQISFGKNAVDTVACTGSGGVKTDGTLWTWGVGTCGLLGDNSTISKSSPVTVAGGGTTWSTIAVGNYHRAAIKTDGTLWTWGRNTYGQLGTNDIVSRSSPGTLSGAETGWSQISAGCHTTMGIKTDGTLWGWGRNHCGQLGQNDLVNRSSPVTVAGGGTDWCGVETQCQYAGGIKTTGTLWTWGKNCWSSLGTSDSVSRSSPGTVYWFGSSTAWTKFSIGSCYTSGAICVTT